MGALIDKNKELKKSSAIPEANFPIILAVAGATNKRSAFRDKAICSG